MLTLVAAARGTDPAALTLQQQHKDPLTGLDWLTSGLQQQPPPPVMPPGQAPYQQQHVWRLVLSESQEATTFGVKGLSAAIDVARMEEAPLPEPATCDSPELAGDGGNGGMAASGEEPEQREVGLLDVSAFTMMSPSSEARRHSIGRIDVSQFRPDGFESLTDSVVNGLPSFTPVS